MFADQCTICRLFPGTSMIVGLLRKLSMKIASHYFVRLRLPSVIKSEY